MFIYNFTIGVLRRSSFYILQHKHLVRGYITIDWCGLCSGVTYLRIDWLIPVPLQNAVNKGEQLQRHIADLESKNSSLQLSIDRLSVNLHRVEGEESDLKEKVKS